MRCIPRFQKLIDEAPDLEHVIVSGDNAHGLKSFEELMTKAKVCTETAPTVRDDIAFWLYTSGSTGKPKGAVHCHADLKLTDDLYGGPFLNITENDVCYSVAKLFFAYGLGNALTFPMSAGACTVLLPDRPTPDGRRGAAAPPSGHRVLRGADLLRGVSGERLGAAARRRQVPLLRVGRRGAADRHRPALGREVRRRHPRRHRLDRDAAHLPVQPRRRREVRHHRQARAGLRLQARRRGRRAGEEGRDGRTAHQGADVARSCTGTIASNPLDVPRPLDPLGRQVSRGRAGLFRLLRPARRHAQGVGALCLAIRGRGGARHPSGRAGGGGRRLARRRRPDQAQGLRRVEGSDQSRRRRGS